ncbi:MAG: lipid IV(A) 3-deoxy-D-manno-octulosonic acid transferase [Burkholderiaceae bacterium]
MKSLPLRLYALVWWLALPLVLGRLWWLGRQQSGYRLHIGERLGFYQAPPAAPLIWIHAVSVGETRAAQPLIEQLLQSYPQHHILLSHMTPTGRATGRLLFASEARLHQVYLPYDTGWMTRRFLRHFQPQLCVLMETEVWPSLIATCSDQQVPVALVNARLSERSLRRAQRFESLLGQAARQITLVAAQTQQDAHRLRLMGARRVEVYGSMKFDIAPPPAMLAAGAALRAQIGPRPVLLCASTREEEEALLLAVFQKQRAALPPDLLLMIVPRHPQRFEQVAQLIEAQGIRLTRRSTLAQAHLPPQTQVLLGDTMGELFAYYAACDLAFIGGSLLPLGGQNLIEAFTCGKPVLIGPHTFNFAQISEDAVLAGAACRVNDAEQLFAQAARLLAADPLRTQMGSAALDFAAREQGATQRTVAMLSPMIQVLV